MKYLLVLVLLIAGYVYAAPSSAPYAQQARTYSHTLSAYGADSIPSSDTVRSAIDSVRQRVRARVMELLRKELHDSVDTLVQ